MPRYVNYIILLLATLICTVVAIIISITISGSRVDGLGFGPFLGFPLASLLVFKFNRKSWVESLLGMLVFSISFLLYLWILFYGVLQLISFQKDVVFLILYGFGLLLSYELSCWLLTKVCKK